MDSIQTPRYPAHQQCQASVTPEKSVPPSGIGRHINRLGNSTELPHWQARGKELQQQAMEIGQPADLWSARATIAPLKKTLSDLLLAVSGISLDTVSRLFSVRHFSAIAPHLHGFARQLTPWDMVGVQAQIVPNITASTLVNQTGASLPAIDPHFKRRLLKILINQYYLDAGQLAKLDDRQFIGAIIHFLRDLPTRAGLMLVRNIQKMQGAYGSHRDEWISVDGQEAIIQRWFENAVFKTDISHFLLQGLLANDNTNATVADLPRLLKPHLNLPQPVLNLWLWNHVVQNAVPILHTTTMHGDTDLRWEDSLQLRLDHFEWGKIHAGLLFAKAVKLNYRNLSMTDAIELGTMLLLQLQEGGAPLEWWRFFELPAKLHYLQTQHTLQHIETDAISFYVSAYALSQQNDCPFLEFQALMNSYQTRPQLAQGIIDEACPLLSVEDYLNWSDDHRRITCDVQGTKIRLQNITQRYQRQINRIADAYEKIAPLLLSAAWGKLSEEEIDFLHKAKISPCKAHFAANDILPLAGLFFYLVHKQRLTIPLKHNVELLAAVSTSTHSEERIYALERYPDGYQVSRIDRAHQAYLPMTDPERKKKYQEGRFTLHIEVFDKVPLKQAQEDPSAFIRHLVQAHRIDFARQLYELGYEKTSQEKIIDFALSMLPLYTCIEASSEGRVGDAVLACSIDAVALVPLLGGLSQLSIKFGQALSRGSMLAAQQVASDWVVRGSLRSVLAQSSQHFLRYAIAPAAQTIGKKEVQSIAIATLRGLDPGAELIVHLSRRSVNQALRLGNYMQHALPSLKKTLPLMENSLRHLPPLPAADSFTYARLPGSTEAQPVVRLEGARYLNEHDIYVRINPDSGEAFGKKYYITADATLAPVPLNMARRLANIRHQGLSGRGGQVQSKVWSQPIAQPVPLSTVVLYRLSTLRKIDFEISGGLRGIAAAMNTQAERLQMYFQQDGTLTPLSQMKLEENYDSAVQQSKQMFYRTPTAQDLHDWKRLTSNPNNSITKYLFAAVRNIRPKTWLKKGSSRISVNRQQK